MTYDIIIIGAGASGLMAAYSAASSGKGIAVLLLEKMPRPGRKIMITGKGRCNFTNVKDWNAFSRHIRTNPNFLKPAYYNFPPGRMLEFLESNGLQTVVERGDRAFPASHRSMDVVDTLCDAAVRAGARIQTGSQVESVAKDGEGFTVKCRSGKEFLCRKLIIATGGLSYPGTGSTGDGYLWAEKLGHSVRRLFPSLTALVPKGYKITASNTSEHVPEIALEGLSRHISREIPLSENGKMLQGAGLKNVRVSLFSGNDIIREDEGDIDFTDGGIEGPIGFSISRDCVKAMLDGAKVRISIDMKPSAPEKELKERIDGLWDEVRHDPRSNKLSTREMLHVLLGKLMPWNLSSGFLRWNPGIISGSRGKWKVDTSALVKALKGWNFDIEGYVGYERCVVTAGGVSTDEVFPKTMESRIVPGLYLCGEVLDIDSDTGGYNLQTAFSTGVLAGQSAASFCLAATL